MLFENENLVPTEKERKLQIYIYQLVNDLCGNEKIEVNSKDLLELLSYLTSSEEISSEMKTATEYRHRNIVDGLHKKEVDMLKKRLKQLEEENTEWRGKYLIELAKVSDLEKELQREE